MKRSLPYIGISRMHERGLAKEQISNIFQKAVDAFKSGKSDEEMTVVIREAEAEEVCRAKFLKR